MKKYSIKSYLFIFLILNSIFSNIQSLQTNPGSQAKLLSQAEESLPPKEIPTQGNKSLTPSAPAAESLSNVAAPQGILKKGVTFSPTVTISEIEQEGKGHKTPPRPSHTQKRRPDLPTSFDEELQALDNPVAAEETE